MSNKHTLIPEWKTPSRRHTQETQNSVPCVFVSHISIPPTLWHTAATLGAFRREGFGGITREHTNKKRRVVYKIHGMSTINSLLCLIFRTSCKKIPMWYRKFSAILQLLTEDCNTAELTVQLCNANKSEGGFRTGLFPPGGLVSPTKRVAINNMPRAVLSWYRAHDCRIQKLLVQSFTIPV